MEQVEDEQTQVSCDLETVTEANYQNEASTMMDYSDERHYREEEQEETIQRVNVTNDVQVSEVNLMINTEGNQEKLEVYNEEVSFEMAGNSEETQGEAQVKIGLYKEEVFVTAIEEVVVLTNEKTNYTTEYAGKTQINTEEAFETVLTDKTQEVNGTSNGHTFTENVEVEVENCLESANVTQYFSAEDTFNLSQDFDCTEETAWKFSKEISSQVENISNGHHHAESADTVLVSSVSESVSEAKISTASTHEIRGEIEVRDNLLFKKRQKYLIIILL